MSENYIILDGLILVTQLHHSTDSHYSLQFKDSDSNEWKDLGDGPHFLDDKLLWAIVPSGRKEN